jgi:hypothetical protein
MAHKILDYLSTGKEPEAKILAEYLRTTAEEQLAVENHPAFGLGTMIEHLIDRRIDLREIRSSLSKNPLDMNLSLLLSETEKSNDWLIGQLDLWGRS